MSFMLMEPSNQSFSELLGNGVTYRVPRFQRDYAWQLEQWEELWSDIESLQTEEHNYMGYMVLQRRDHNDYEIIDGQQRLITLSLVVLAAIRRLKDLSEQPNATDAKENAARVDLLTSQYVGRKNAISLRVDNKLSLNRNNQTHFRALCSNFGVSSSYRISATNRLLNKGFEYFFRKDMGSNGEEIAKYVERLSTGMIFTKIVVHDEINAYKVFETLNARGVQLSTPDLLKNYLFSIVTRDDSIVDADLDDIDERWAGIVEDLGEGSFTRFVRHHHNARWSLVGKRELFAALRKQASSPKLAFEYLQSIEKYAPLFSALRDPSSDWRSRQQDGKLIDCYSSLKGLRLFNISQPLPLLMSGFFHFSPAEFVKLCRYVYVLSVRYNVVCHQLPSIQEKAYNRLCLEIAAGRVSRASHVKNHAEFRRIYPDDEEFTREFLHLRMPSRQSPAKIRLLLSEIEAHLGTPEVSDKLSLEHICPEKPTEAWQAQFGEGALDIRDRVGNMVLLSEDKLGRADFSEKVKTYAKSRRPLAEYVARTFTSWNMDALRTYQQWLAGLAAQTWRVDFE